jgi:dienelactone hydrolase
MKFLCYIICFTFAFQDQISAQQSAQKYTRQTDYLLSLPDGYNADTVKRWPLMIFLHGSGECGDDLEKVKVNGPPKLIAHGKKFSFIVVSPQAKEDDKGWEPDHLYHFLKYIKKAYRVDPDRIYLTGLSMGGFGTWALAIDHPEEFAAIVPICGGGDTSKAWRLRYTPVWCFHGALDNIVPVAKDEQMVNALRNYNPSIRFTVYPDANHNSWEKAYATDSLYDWLLAQKKFAYKEVKADPKLMYAYEGVFKGASGDTIKIYTDSAGLHAKTSDNTYLLKLQGGDTFFIFENVFVDLRFNRDEKGAIDSFTVFEESKTIYRRVHTR